MVERRKEVETVKWIAGFSVSAFALCGALAWGGSAPAAEDRAAGREDRYVLYYDKAHKLPVNLGPTGAWGYVCADMIVVRGTAPGSPARGTLQEYDIIVGADGRLFGEEDPRVVLGNAITESETRRGNGTLELAIVRDGAEESVSVQLRVIGTYGAKWPFECEKSEAVSDGVCRYLTENAQMHVIGAGVSRAWHGLFLLSSGKPEHLDVVRRAAYHAADDPLIAGHVSWSRGYAGVFLAEYYLATGDATVLPKLRELAGVIAAGQMRCGSWGHGMPWGGYGAVNQVGLACFLALALAKECGVEVDEGALARSAVFFSKYAGKGWIPYGDHPPWRGKSGNGKDALAAVVFDVLGTHADAADAYSKAVAASYEHREEGHTGAFFSFSWGPLAAVRAPRKSFRRFADHQSWYYDLARTHDGGFVCQPNPENLSHGGGVYTQRGPQWTTGGMAMLYALPRRSLRILGGPKGVFAEDPPARLEQAAALFKQKRWGELATFLKAFLAERGLSRSEKVYARKVFEAYERMEEGVSLTLDAIDGNIRKGDYLAARGQLAAVRRLVGEDRPQMTEFAAALGSEEVTREIETAKHYYRAVRYYKTIPSERRLMEHVAASKSRYYGKLAAEALAKAQPVPAKLDWETLVASSKDTPQEWKYCEWGEARDEADIPPPRQTSAAPAGCYRDGFDDSAWKTGVAPFGDRRRRGTPQEKDMIVLRKRFSVESTDYAQLGVVMKSTPGMKVYLNGLRVLEVAGRPSAPYELVVLRGNAVGLLRRGGNVIAVFAEGRGAVDVGLRGAREKRE